VEGTRGGEATRIRLVVSASGAARLEAVAACLRERSPADPIAVVSATRGAADDLVRRVAGTRSATIGIYRFSLTQLAARLAVAHLSGRGVAPVTALGLEAIAARAAFEAAGDEALPCLAAVSGTPGFPRAVARTLRDLREARIPADAVRRTEGAGPDVAQLLERASRFMDAAAVADRARLLEAAIDGMASDPVARLPLVLVDVPVESHAEEQFLLALTRMAAWTFAVVPRHDTAARDALVRAGGVEQPAGAPPVTDLERLQVFLFAPAAPPVRPPDETVECFSAPGEGRECAEIARRVLAAAARGVRFDEMAVFVRPVDRYQGLIEQAFARARVPAWFERGVRRPHPAGRALLALLACADEGGSARRFAEYLSLGQVPAGGAESPGWVGATSELFGSAARPSGDADATQERDMAAAGSAASHDAPWPAPRHWERLLVESSVIGGDVARWARRLDGLAGEIQARLGELEREDPDSPRIARLRRDREGLEALRAFVLPLVGELSAWPRDAVWGGWLDRLDDLASRMLRTPQAVRRVLADLRPMADVGPVPLADVRRLLGDRLRLLDVDPPADRSGRVFVGTPALARGRAFRVVFVPGVAERMFPRRPDHDPLLLDEARTTLGATLATRAEQGRRDRLLLHLAVGAATERLHVSYPRLDAGEGRPRVPSFYVLDLVRGATGEVPPYEQLAEAAARAGDRTLAWPAPADPAGAIDDQEHDLAVLRRLLDTADPDTVRGQAQYLLRLNPALRRSVTERWMRAEPRWSPYDGLVRVVDRTAPALAAHRLTTRVYSLSALQRFATCPYQFLLGAIYRLAPTEAPRPLQRLDPLTRGSLVHRIQMLVGRTLAGQGALPVTRDSLDAAAAVLEATVREVADEYRERLVPAVDRVWREEMAGIARDLRGWLQQVAGAGDQWTPYAFELAFGLPEGDRDPRSRPDPVTIDGRFRLRGSVDLVERHQRTGALRVTDHKTGRNRTADGMTIGGGAVLQPVLYSLAVEQITGQPVEEARLFFCTAAGGYASRTVALSDEARRAGVEALEVIDRAIETGCLPPAPLEGACRWCDFRVVCGPDQESRVRRKPEDRLRDLVELRRRR
jgi:ATP-dependent helicase/nuclease subunit B